MKHIAKLTHPPKNAPVDNSYSFVTDGAVSGNGDIGIVWGGDSKNISIYISKSDFWKSKPVRNESGICVIGKIDINLPEANDDYLVEQDMDNCTLTGTFTQKNGICTIKVTPVATENIILVEMTLPENAPHSFDLTVIDGKESRVSCGEKDGMEWISKEFSGKDLTFDSAAIIAKKEYPAVTEKGNVTYRYAFSVVTNHDSPNYRNLAIDRLFTVDEWKFNWLKKSHKLWWNKFWSISSVQIADEELELNWYSGLYIMACCARNPLFPPGIFGNFITNNSPEWCGDYHLNYNFEAPFYPIFSSNHCELGKCYDHGFTDFIASGKKFSADFLGCKGVYFPVGLGPLGTEPSINAKSLEFGHHFLGQKSNASYAATVVCMHWYSTYDKEYAMCTAYPYLKEVADFWESYMKFEDDRYVIYKDAIHEVDFWRDNFDPETTPNFINDFNNLLSLGAVRMVLKCLLDMQKELGVTEEKKEKWEHILSHISKFPTFEKDGKTVFRYTERGMEWRDTNALAIQHIYPCGEIGMFSDSEEFEIARNTFLAVERWDDQNAFSSYYPCAARLKIEPETIISNLKNIYKKRQSENMMFNIFGGCLENTSATTTTINEMMLQSHKNIISVFPDWPKELDAEFKSLRAYGAFTVSAQMKASKLTYAEIRCERDTELKVVNPYPTAVVTHNGKTINVTDKIISLDVCNGDIVMIKEQ